MLFSTFDHRHKSSTLTVWDEDFQPILAMSTKELGVFSKQSKFVVAFTCFYLIHRREFYKFIVFSFAFDGSLQVRMSFVSPSQI